MACRQKPQPTGKRPRGRKNKPVDKKTTSKAAKKKDSKTLEPATQVSRQEETCEYKDVAAKNSKKWTRKALSKKEREKLIKCLNEVNPKVLTALANSKLHEQSYFSETLINLVDSLIADDQQLAEDIINNQSSNKPLCSLC